jgi:hypothetical protein
MRSQSRARIREVASLRSQNRIQIMLRIMCSQSRARIREVASLRSQNRALINDLLFNYGLYYAVDVLIGQVGPGREAQSIIE